MSSCGVSSIDGSGVSGMSSFVKDDVVDVFSCIDHLLGFMSVHLFVTVSDFLLSLLNVSSAGGFGSSFLLHFLLGSVHGSNVSTIFVGFGSLSGMVMVMVSSLLNGMGLVMMFSMVMVSSLLNGMGLVMMLSMVSGFDFEITEHGAFQAFLNLASASFVVEATLNLGRASFIAVALVVLFFEVCFHARLALSAFLEGVSTSTIVAFSIAFSFFVDNVDKFLLNVTVNVVPVEGNVVLGEATIG